MVYLLRRITLVLAILKTVIAVKLEYARGEWPQDAVRALKNTDGQQQGGGPPVIESAIGTPEPQGFGNPDQAENVTSQAPTEYPSQVNNHQQVAGQNHVGRNEVVPQNDGQNNNNNNNNNANQQGNITAVQNQVTTIKLPELVLEMGLIGTTTAASNSNAAATKQKRGDKGNTGSSIQSLLKTYFDNLYTTKVMGSNYVSSELEVAMSKNEPLNGGSLLDFNIKGNAAYIGNPVPSEKDVEKTLADFFANWNKNDLETYLDNSGMNNAAILNFTIRGAPLDPGQRAQVEGSSTTTSNANAAAVATNKKKAPAGLITGLCIFSICVFIAGIVMVYKRKEIFTECDICCDMARNKVRGAKGNNWHDMDDDDNAAKAKPQDTTDGENSVRSRFSLPSLSSRRRNEKQKTAEVLRQIKVWIDRNQMLTKTDTKSGYKNYSVDSQAQSSENTVPRTNQASPAQKNLKTMTIGLDAEYDYSYSPDMRYGQPSPETPATMKSTPDKPALGDEETGTLADWAAYLNPCLIPHALIFRRESERLDNIVASLPRNKSMFDEDSTIVSNEQNQPPAATPPRPTFANRGYDAGDVIPPYRSGS